MSHADCILPKMAIIKQDLYRSPITDIPDTVRTALKNNNKLKITAGETVAVAVGSRGIRQIDTIVHQTIRFLIQLGLKPFIIPAMGSHGGGTPEAQKSLLNKLGISKSTMGVPIISDMDVANIGSFQDETNIYISKTALSANHIVVINRIKSHTKFRSDIESGLCKMMVVGLGKKKGAAEIHLNAIHHSFRIIENAAAYILKKCNILFGLAIVEDGYGQPAHIEALSADSLINREKNLLKKASAHLARIPFEQIDVLIIDHIGKDISGIGMDSNVTGRHRDITGDFQVSPFVKRIFVRDLSPDSDGNGNGIGLADVTTKRLVDALDLKKTYTNAIAAISPEKAAIPLYLESDAIAIETCIQTCGVQSPETARIIRIKNTADLEYLQISDALSNEVTNDLQILTPWTPMQFNTEGNLSDFHSHLQ